MASPHTAAFIALLLSATHAAELHVSPSGNDTNPGTSALPLATFTAAQTKARSLAGTEPVTVTFHAGSYYLADTIHFSAADSGTAANPILYRAATGEVVVISGGNKLGGLTWTTHSGSILKATVPAGMVIDQLFANNSKQVLARYPNYNASTAIFNGYAADCISTTRAGNWANPTGGYFHALHASRWGGMEYRITGKDASNNVSYTGGWQNNRPSSPHTTYRFVENIFEELDAPGEWFHNTTTNTLYFNPPSGLNLSTATLETAGRLKHLIEFDGTQAEPVRFVNFQGLVFRHAARTFMETNEPLLRSDWCIYRGGAVVFEGSEDCNLSDCEFDQLGGNAVFFSRYNRRTSVQHSWFHDIGASGVCFVGDPGAVRNPLFTYSQSQAYSAIDITNAGPKTDNYPADCSVADCLITGIGRVEKQPAGVQISMASRITVSHCSIYDCARAGINIGDGCWGGHVIDYCDVFDTVLETNDHGSFNGWGRDRYWNLSGSPSVTESKRISMLDNYQTTIIRNSRWQCDHGWDIDLDDGCTNYSITNNLLLKNGLKWREGFNRTGRNNIILNNSLNPHAWYATSGDIFEKNIVQDAYLPAAMSSSLTQWGQSLDYNLFPTEANRTAYTSKGCDAHSLAGDPQFVNAVGGNYQVQAGSPALTLGFTNFPMDQFGVQKASLKAIARIPSGVGVTLTPPVPSAVFRWLGAQVKGVTTSEEASAYGTDPSDGGIFFSGAYPESAIAATGLLENDLIASINGTAVKTVPDMIVALSAANGDVTFGIVRGQAATSLVVPAALLADTGTLALESGGFRVPDAGLNVDAFVLIDGIANGYGTITTPDAELRGGTLTAGLNSTGPLTKATASATVVGGPLACAGGTSVAAGTLRLDPNLTPPVRNGLLLRLDASAASSMTFNGNNVSQWADADGNGSYAEQAVASQQPARVAAALNGRPILDFGSYLENTTGRFMAFKDAAGADLSLSTIRSAFWVMKGSNHLLTHTSTYDFHRGGNADTATSTIWNATYASANIRNGQTFLGGTQVNGTATALSASYNLVSVIATGNVGANRLCADRTNRTGGQQIAEVILYNRALSASERQQVEGYLNHKWFTAAATSGPVLSNSGLDLAAASTLDLGGLSQTVGPLTGAGTIINSDSAACTLTASPSASAAFSGSISGTSGGAISVAKTGGGTQTFSGTSSYTGTTAVNSGTLEITGTPNALRGTTSIANGATLHLHVAGASDVTYPNAFSGAGILKVAPPGSGFVAAVLPGALGGLTGTLDLLPGPAGGGKIRFTNTTQANTPPAAATIKLENGATLYLSAALNYASAFQLFGGTTGEAIGQLRLDGATVTGPVTLMGNASVGTNTGTGTISGAIGGAFGLAKEGNGPFILSGTNTYTGTTTVRKGTLTLTHPVLADGAGVDLAAGTTLSLAYTGTDTISTLTLAGAAQATGTWGATGSAADHTTAAITGTGLLRATTTANPYMSWASSFAALADEASRAPTADPDGDGRSNLLEFALDGNPTLSFMDGKTRQALASISGSSYLSLTTPIRNGAMFSGSGALASAPLDGLTYTIQGSSGLADFSSPVVEVIPALSSGMPAPTSGWEYRTFRLGTPVSASPQGFLRIVVTPNP